MVDTVEVLSEQIGVWGAQTCLYVLRCREREFQVSIVPLPEDDNLGFDAAYSIGISELLRSHHAEPLSIVGNLTLSCCGRQNPLATAARVIDRLTDHRMAELFKRASLGVTPEPGVC